jgi:hypothetical protein
LPFPHQIGVKFLLRRAQRHCGGGTRRDTDAALDRIVEQNPRFRSMKATSDRAFEDFLELARKDVAKLAAEPADPVEHAHWLTQRDAVALLVAAHAKHNAFFCRLAAQRVEQEPVLHELLLDAQRYCDELRTGSEAGRCRSSS